MSVSDWWPFGSLTASSPADSEPVLLRYKRPTQLVDLQPSLLRWGCVWAAISLLYGSVSFVPEGDPQLIASIFMGVLWFISGGMTVVLLIVQSRRRRLAEIAALAATTSEPASPSATTAGAVTLKDDAV